MSTAIGARVLLFGTTTPGSCHHHGLGIAMARSR
jgi:hypothetical protein